MDARQLLIRLMRWTLAWASTPARACKGMPTLRQAFRPRLREPSAKSPEPEIRLADGVRQQPVLQPEQQVAQRVAGMAVAGCSKSAYDRARRFFSPPTTACPFHSACVFAMTAQEVA